MPIAAFDDAAIDATLMPPFLSFSPPLRHYFLLSPRH
jgi:hypothetical protein